jgi:hypothetical protein
MWIDTAEIFISDEGSDMVLMQWRAALTRDGEVTITKRRPTCVALSPNALVTAKLMRIKSSDILAHYNGGMPLPKTVIVSQTKTVSWDTLSSCCGITFDFSAERLRENEYPNSPKPMGIW